MHFATIVILPDGIPTMSLEEIAEDETGVSRLRAEEEILDALHSQMEPFRERYNDLCFECPRNNVMQDAARTAAKRAATQEVGREPEPRKVRVGGDPFQLEPETEQQADYRERWSRVFSETLRAQPSPDGPDPDCPNCFGTGWRGGEEPAGFKPSVPWKFDWMTIGGRFDGFINGHPTERRPIPEFGEFEVVSVDGRVEFHLHALGNLRDIFMADMLDRLMDNINRVADIAAEFGAPWACVTPDGEWLELRGGEPDVDTTTWAVTRSVYANHTAVLVDCHS
jgi:hypothetical protein